jgi:protein involved in polysaccharide export with SLBB domain
MKRALLLSSTGLLLTLLSGCHTSHEFTARSQFAAPPAEFSTVSLTNRLAPELLQPPANFFTLGPGDRIQIEILGQTNSRALTFVGPDGKLYYHLLSGLDVWGLTLTQTRDLLEEGLSKYLSEPRVGVTLREVGSKSVWLLGRLNRPGIYPMPAPMTLLESIALAGGTARSSSQNTSEELADLRHSFVMRQGQLLPVNFHRLLREGDTSQNIVLQPDDFVYVPSALAQEVYVLGCVRLPRAVPYTEEMTLVTAIAGASGPLKYDYLSRYDSVLTPDALLSHVAIVRGSLTEPRIAVVDAGAIMKGHAPDVPLEPGDIIYIPNSPFRFIKSYLNLILNSFVSTVAANEGIRAGGGEVGVSVSVPVTGR